jgi:hypothetical protein
MQRRVTTAILGVNVRTVLDQTHHGLDVTLPDGGMKRFSTTNN